MAALSTISETIDIGNGSLYLMANDISNGSLFGKRLPSNSSPIMVGIVTDALDWQNATSPSDSTLRGTANYLLWLCGKYGLQAKALTGGGSVTPITPGTPPAKLEFTVANSGTPMVTGDSTITLTAFIGYELVFMRGGSVQYQYSDGTNTYYTWNAVTGKFECFGVLTEGEQVSFRPAL